jgi:hypothetical protein
VRRIGDPGEQLASIVVEHAFDATQEHQLDGGQ